MTYTVSSLNPSLPDYIDNSPGSALKNWTSGLWANGTTNPSGAPSLYGANFQSITWAQQNAGYLPNGQPNTTLLSAFHAADASLKTFLTHLHTTNKLTTTLLLLGSKQGQGPTNPTTLTVTDPQTVITAAAVPVSYFVGEDGGIVWLETASDAQTAKRNLLSSAAKLGISYVLAGDEVTLAGYGSPFLDPRVPDLIIGAKVGTLWNVGFEFEDHGGFLPQDLNVPLIAYNPNFNGMKNVTEEVSNRQVASTMLQALGLPLAQLDGWRMGGAPVLPGLF